MTHSKSNAAIEWFAGIGGMSLAWPECKRVLAVDINEIAHRVYRRNLPHTYLTREIGTISLDELTQWESDFWWMSPPCQPHTRKGMQRDLSDPRSQAFVALVGQIENCRPATIALENVGEFAGSQAHQLLCDTLARLGYQIRERSLCPTEMGWPNRRPRYYLLASLGDMPAWSPLPNYDYGLESLLVAPESAIVANSEEERSLQTAPQWMRFEDAMDRIQINPQGKILPNQVTSCFTRGYGRSAIHCGSYLQTQSGWRHFSPREVANLLGFPPHFELGDLTRRQAWQLLGNSLSLPAVRYVLAHLPSGPSIRLPWLESLETTP